MLYCCAKSYCSLFKVVSLLPQAVGQVVHVCASLRASVAQAFLGALISKAISRPKRLTHRHPLENSVIFKFEFLYDLLLHLKFSNRVTCTFLFKFCKQMSIIYPRGCLSPAGVGPSPGCSLNPQPGGLHQLSALPYLDGTSLGWYLS